MSQAHRPTWNPTQGKETKAGSQQISKLGLAAHTKLKFRQPGQTSAGDVARRDLKAELAAAERIATDKKRKAQGLPALPPPSSASTLRIDQGQGEETDGSRVAEEAGEDEERVKRRKLLEEALAADRDESDDEADDEAEGGENGDGQRIGNGVDKGKRKATDNGEEDDEEAEEDDDSDDDDSDDEDDTAALMAELAKIKQERAEEKARMDAEAAASTAASREQEIATGNPLLNLQAALGQAPDTPSTPATPASSIGTGGFTVKRRWDDDLIFKNQAAGVDEKNKKGEFINDLLRSEFHKKFMLKFIK